MKHLNIPILLSTAGLIAGIILANFFETSLIQCLYFLALLLLCMVGLHLAIKKFQHLQGAFTIVLLVFFTGLGWHLHTRLLPKNNISHYTHHIKDSAQTVFIEIQEVLKPTLYQNKFVAQVIGIDQTTVAGKILINISKDTLTTPSYSVGDRFYLRTKILTLPSPKNPYQFDYGAYLKHKEIYRQVSIHGSDVLKSEVSGTGLRVLVARFRKSIQTKLKTHAFSQDQLAILNALILGQRQGIDRELNTQYAAAGMIHILAVSGLHVGIILLLLRFITRPIGSYTLRFVRSSMIIILIWLFAILTGLSPSVLRAATMFSFLEASTLLRSKKETSNALIVSAFVLLIFDPLLIYQVGFQLSYMAVLAILWIQPWLSNLLIVKNKILRFFWDTVTVTTAAQIGVMPLSLFYFHQFPGLFLVSNLVILPVLSSLLIAGILVIILSSLDILPDFLVVTVGKAIDFLNYFIGWIASKETFVFKYIYISLPIMIGLYVLFISAIALFKKYSYRRFIATGFAIILFCSILIFQKKNTSKTEFIVFHKYQQTLLGEKSNKTLVLQTGDTLWDYKTDNRVMSYRNNVALDTVLSTSLKNIISFKEQQLLIVDSLGIYTIADYKPDYVLLTQSPNINLDRLIELYPKATIIADGNNYKSDTDRWKATCQKRKIPFHSTYKKGAFTLK